MLIDYTPPPICSKFIQNPSSVNLIMGPLGSGKTTAAIMKTLYHAANQAPAADGKRYTKFAYIRNTGQQLMDTVYQSFIRWFPPGSIGTWRASERIYQIRAGDIHCDVLFRALDTEEDQKRVLSMEVTGAFFNELREINRTIFTAVRGRCARYPSGPLGLPTWHGVFADTNPPDDDSWVYEKFEKDKPERWAFYKQPGGLSKNAENKNILDKQNPRYYEELCEGATEEWIGVHVHGKYGSSAAGKPVYEKTWKTEFHTESKLYEKYFQRYTPIYLGFDFGRTPAAVIKQKLPNGTLLTLEEICSDNSGLDLFLQTKVKPVLNARYLGSPVFVTGDPSGWDKSQLYEVTAQDIFASHGLVAVKCTTNDPAIRINAVETNLMKHHGGKSAYLVDPEKCPMLVRGFKKSYKYKEKKDGSYETKPHKNEYSHPHDANQYVDVMLNNPQIDWSMFTSVGVPRVETVSLDTWA